MIFSRHPNLNQVKSIAPVVYHFAALAKEQTNPEEAVVSAVECAINDPDKFNKHARDIALGLGRYLHDNPEDAIACIVELLIPLKAPSIVKLKQVQSIVSVVREQQLFARTVQFSSNIANKLTSPIKTIVADAQAVIETGLQCGKTAMHNLIKVAEAEPEIASAGDIMALKVPPECFSDAGKLASEVGALRSEKVITKEFRLLKPVGNNAWQSPKGLIFGEDAKFGNRLNHVLEHMIPNPTKKTHTVFNTSREKIIELLDEAWTKKGDPLGFDPGAYIVDMKKIIGTNGESAIRIIVKPGTAEIITAYPVKL